MPVEPWLRWLIDTPWLASRPEKFQRFMPPAKPLPLLVPHTSTLWPTTKCAADSVAPGSSSASGATRNSTSFAFGSTFALAKWPRFGLRHVLHLGAAPAELHGVVAVRLLGARGDHLHLIQMQHGDRHMRAVVLEHPGHAQLLGQQSRAHIIIPRGIGGELRS